MSEYAVTQPVGSAGVARGARHAAPLLAIGVGLWAAASTLPDDLPAGGLAAGLMALAALRVAIAMRPAAVLRVGPAGIELEEQRVPWRSIGRITITRYAASLVRSRDEVEVAVTLRAQPSSGPPSGPPLRAIARGDRVNVGQLALAIRAHALSDTAIVDQQDPGSAVGGGAGNAPERRPTGPYVLTQTSSPRGVLRRVMQAARRRLLAFVLLLTLVVISTSGLVEPEWAPLLRTAAVLTAAALAVIVAWAAWPQAVLRVGASGVEFAARSVPGLARDVNADRAPWPSAHADTVTIPWSSIWQVVVMYPDPGSTAGDRERPLQIGLRPRRNAPLPGHVAVRVSDPSDPLAIPPRLRASVQDENVDLDALVRAVRTYGFTDTPVVETRGSAERVLG